MVLTQQFYCGVC